MAATTGPAAGRLWALAAGSRVLVDDLEVQSGARFFSRGSPDALRIRVRGPRTARMLPRHGDGRPGRISRRWQRGWREGRSVQHGETTYELRRRPRLEDWTFDSAPTAAEPAAVSGTTLGTTLTMGIAPAVGSFALAATMRQPLFALFALVGPLAMLVPHLLEARRRRAAERAGLAPASRALAARPKGAAPPGQASRGPATRPAGPPLPRPADLVTRAVAAHLAPDLPVQAEPSQRTAAGAADADAGARWTGQTFPTGASPSSVAGNGLSPRCGHSSRTWSRRSRVTVSTPDERRTDWSWCRWLPGARRGHGGDSAPRPRHEMSIRSPEELHVLVVDGARLGGWSATLGRWWAARTGADRVVLIETERSRVPAWCRTVLDVGGAFDVDDAAGRTRWTLPDGSVTTCPLVGATDGWATRFARRVAAAERLGRWPAGRRAAVGGDASDPADRSLPRRTSLVALLGTQSASSPRGRRTRPAPFPTPPGSPRGGLSRLQGSRSPSASVSAVRPSRSTSSGTARTSSSRGRRARASPRCCSPSCWAWR